MSGTVAILMPLLPLYVNITMIIVSSCLFARHIVDQITLLIKSFLQYFYLSCRARNYVGWLGSRGRHQDRQVCDGWVPSSISVLQQHECSPMSIMIIVKEQ
jgi:hypothetical protein